MTTALPRALARSAALVAACALLAACGGDAAGESDAEAGGAPGSKVSAGEMRAEAEALELTPGRWSTRVELGSMQIPGISKEMMAGMQAQGMGTPEIITCLTADDIRGRGKLFDTGQGTDCKVSRYDLSGGTIDIAQSCKGPDGTGSADIAMKGSYTADSYTIDMTVNSGADAGPAAGSSFTSRVIGKRLGACTGDEARPAR